MIWYFWFERSRFQLYSWFWALQWRKRIFQKVRRKWRREEDIEIDGSPRWGSQVEGVCSESRWATNVYTCICTCIHNCFVPPEIHFHEFSEGVFLYEITTQLLRIYFFTIDERNDEVNLSRWFFYRKCRNNEKVWEGNDQRSIKIIH